MTPTSHEAATCGCSCRHDETPSRRRWRRPAQLGAAGLVAVALLTGGPAPREVAAATLVPGAPADTHVVSLGAEWNVNSPGPGYLSGFPQAFATDTVVDGVTQRKVLVSWAENRDTAAAESVDGLAVSDNGARTFTKHSERLMAISMVRLDDGSIFATEFLPTTDAAGAIAIKTARSTDLGKTWTRGTAKLVQDKVQFVWIRVHRGVHQLTDGTLLMPAYGVAQGQTRNRSVLLQSTDRGDTWTIRNAAIMPPTATLGTNEMALSRTSDGRLVGFLRADGNSSLYQTYSDDDGVTWTPPAVINAPAGAPRGWVDPGVVLQPNGMLVLSYGRPDNTLLVSRDGTGRTWDDHRNVFANAPRETSPARFHGSSANTAIVSVSANQSVVFGDSCANIWGCKEYGQLHRVWARMVDAVTPGTGKVDLATKVRSGTVKLSGDVAAGPRAFPETRIEGATDGSSERHAAAPLAKGGKLVVELDRMYTVDRVGLMLGYGGPQDADVQFSVDGKAWSQPALKPRGTVDYAVRYHQIAPTQAKYVKISAPAGGNLDAVTELELYAADTKTFENDAVNAPPRDFTDTRYAWVADTIIPGADSRRRLTLVDLDPQAIATATLPTAATAAQRVAFQYASSQYGAGVVFSVRGKDTGGDDVTAWQFWIVPNPATNTLRVRARTSAGWQDIGVAPLPPAERWMPVAIDTTATEARVNVNGATLAPTTHRWHEAASYTGITFSSWSNQDANMQHEFDDVQVTPLP